MTDRFYTDVYAMSACKSGEELCGDKVYVKYSGNGSVIVLADGLGSGVKANILATLTSRILGTMLSEGASIEDCVETISATLPVCRERGVAYSTFTMIEVDNNGDVYTAEFDGPEMVNIRDGVLDESVQKHKRILNGRVVWESRFRAQEGDMLVAFSDGVIHAGVGQLINLGWKRANILEFIQRTYRKNMPARTMTQELLRTCVQLYQEEPGDDTTVVTVHILPRAETRVLVGPPADMKDDAKVVEILMSASGNRIVCGGSTSQVVARELQQEIKAETEIYDEKVPPAAHINGIDLVTEGILTLTAAEELLDRYKAECEQGTLPETYTDLEKKDGATRLIRMLLDESSDIVFMLGQANNPAYNKGDTRLGLDAKMRIITSIAEKLKYFGKNTRIEEY